MASRTAPPLRALQYPHFPRNPYQSLLAGALVDEGVTTGFTTGLRPVARAVLWREAEVLHIHWTHFLILKGWARSLLRITGFAVLLALARLRGIGVVWTIHNARAHDGRKPVLDHAAAAIAAHFAHRVIAHGPEGARIAHDIFGAAPGKITIIPHANYRGQVAALPPRAGTGRLRLFAFGQVRGYKGFDDLARAVAALDGSADLVIAGAPANPRLAARLRRRAAGKANIRFVPGHLGQEALENWLGWADFVVLPYRQILTSGVLLMSLSAGRPVILPRLGDLPAYVTPASAILYNPEGGLDAALARAAAMSPAIRRRMARAAALEAGRFCWTDAARDTAQLYRQSTGAEADTPLDDAAVSTG